MKLGFKKWFSILGLLLAIIISLGIGTYFDLSILEGMTPGEEVTEEEEPPVEEVIEEEEPLVEEVIEEKPIMQFSNMSNPDSPSRKKTGEEVYKNIMDNDTTEPFSIIRNF
jgi:hypothetical protein